MVGVKEICALLLAGGIGAGSVVTVQEAVPAIKKASSPKAAKKPAVRKAARRPAVARSSQLNDCPSQVGLLGQNMALPPLPPIDIAPGLPLTETALGLPGGGGGGIAPGGGGSIGGNNLGPTPPDGGSGLVPGVPETGSWAMLITGFGLIGLAMRRTKGRQPDAGR